MDRNRLPGQINRLVILLQPEIGPCFAAIKMNESWIVRAEPNGLVEIIEGFFKLPEFAVDASQESATASTLDGSKARARSYSAMASSEACLDRRKY